MTPGYVEMDMAMDMAPVPLNRLDSLYSGVGVGAWMGASGCIPITISSAFYVCFPPVPFFLSFCCALFPLLFLSFFSFPFFSTFPLRSFPSFITPIHSCP